MTLTDVTCVGGIEKVSISQIPGYSIGRYDIKWDPLYMCALKCMCVYLIGKRIKVGLLFVHSFMAYISMYLTSTTMKTLILYLEC